MPLANLGLFVFCGFIHIFFRIFLYTYCRNLKIRKRDIHKKMKGFSNYWLFSQLNKEYNLGIYYYLNFIHLICCCITVPLMPLSYIPCLEIPTIIIGIVISLITLPVYFISLSYANLESFGKKFVFFRITKSSNGRRRFSSIFDWLFGFFPLAIYIFFILNN